MDQIFVSYARQDKNRIQSLLRVLADDGWTVFWDHRIPTAGDWRSIIEQKLEEASAVVVVWSRRSVKSKWVIEEAEEGMKRNILIPVLLDQVEPRMGFRSIQCRDIRDWDGCERTAEIQALLAGIRSTAGAPARPPRVLPSPAPTHVSDYRLPASSPSRVTAGVLGAILGATLGLLAARLGRVEFHAALSLFTALGAGIAGAICGMRRERLALSLMGALVSGSVFGVCAGWLGYPKCSSRCSASSMGVSAPAGMSWALQLIIRGRWASCSAR